MTERKIEKMNYEEAFSELEKIVTLLENEQHPLNESMLFFERGQDLSKRCMVLLEEAELKVKQLSGGELYDE